MKFYKNYKKLIWILIVAWLVRMIGIWHGLPDVYSVDEPALLNSIFGLRFDKNPHHFDWPHFHFYLSYVIFGIFYKARIGWQIWGWKPFLENLYPILWQDPAPYYLVIRSLNATLGALTVLPIYLASKKLFSEKVAVLAAIIFVFAPFHVDNSHFATIDVPSAFWAAWVIYFSAKILFEGKLKDYILAGLFLGIAASTKYHAGFYALMILFAHLGFFYKGKKISWFLGNIYREMPNIVSSLPKLMISAVVSITAFFAGTPYALLDWKTFIRAEDPTGAFWQFSRQGKRYQIIPTTQRLFQHMFITFSKLIGYIPEFFAIYAVRESFFTKGREILLVSISALTFFLYVGSSEFSPIRIFTVLVPVLSMLSAYGFYEFIRVHKLKGIAVNRLMVLLLIIPILRVVYMDIAFARKDTRQLAKDWVTQNLPDGARIARKGEYLPGLRPKGEGDPYKGFYDIGVKEFSYSEFSQKGGVEYAWYGDFNYSEDMIKAKSEYYKEVIENSEKIAEFSPLLRRGPNIFVYKIRNPDKQEF